METTTLGKITIASEQMLDLAKSKNDSDSDAENSNQFDNSSPE